MKIRDVYTANVVTASADDSLLHAADRMSMLGVGSLAVTREGRVVGILTERDLVHAMADRVDPRLMAISRYMTPDPELVDVEEDSDRAATLMQELGIAHLPVVQDGEVVGIVTTRDLLALEDAGL